MSEERMFILKMVAEGKITADEAAALLDALDDEEDDDGRVGGRARVGDDTDDIDDDESRRKERRTGQDFVSHIGESIQTALRNVPHLAEELKEGWNEVRKDLSQSFRDVKEEIKKKRLVDFSGLSEFLAQVREVGLGPSHEFEERMTGEFPADARPPKLEFVTKNGSVTVSGWDRATYEIVVRKKVYGRDEHSAKAVADGAVVRDVGEGWLRIDGRATRGVTVSLDVKLPKDRPFTLEATSQNGSVVVEDLVLDRVRASTTNGSVRVDDVTAAELLASTVNGKVWGDDVDATACEVRTVNGAVEWSGRALRSELKTVNGSIRYSPELIESDEDDQGLVGLFEVRTVNGSVRIHLPKPSDVGIGLDLSGRSVEIDNELRFVTESVSDRLGEAPKIVAKSQTYEEARRRMDLAVNAVNGSIWVVGAGGTQSGGKATSGEPDDRKEEESPQTGAVQTGGLTSGGEACGETVSDSHAGGSESAREDERPT